MHARDGQGAPGALAEAAPALAECDLTGNLLPDWTAIAAVLDELPRLRALNLTASRLAPLSLPDDLPVLGPFAGLRTLVLNRCGISRWAEVRHLLSLTGLVCSIPSCVMVACTTKADCCLHEQVLAVASGFPQLRELHLAGNSISELQPAVSEVVPRCLGYLEVSICSARSAALAGFTRSCALDIYAAMCCAAAMCKLCCQAQVLDLDDNRLASWVDVQTLSQLPCLQRMSLTGNSIADVADQGLAVRGEICGPLLPQKGREGPAASDYDMPSCAGGFPALRALLLGDNAVASWASVDALTSIPSLREARLSGNTALGADQSQVRSEVPCWPNQPFMSCMRMPSACGEARRLHKCTW